MQATGINNYHGSLIKLHCDECGRVVRVPACPPAPEAARAALIGWQVGDDLVLRCDLCQLGLIAAGSMAPLTLAEAIEAEDRRPKQTDAEAEQGYGLEIVTRFVTLASCLKNTGQITPHVFALVAEAAAALNLALSYPDIKPWGNRCAGERGSAQPWEAL